MIFSWPWWLALALPLGILLWLWRGPRRLLTVLRFAILALAVLALADPHLLLPRKSGMVVLIADRSYSMPPDAERQQDEAVRLVAAEMGDDQQLAVVSFGQAWSVEHVAGKGQYEGVAKSQVGGDASELGEAVDAALAVIGSRPGRILLLSDGRWTGKDPVAAAARAASAGVAVDYRLIQRSPVGDLSIERFEGPESVTPGEGVLLAAHVNSPLAQKVRYELLRHGEKIAAGSSELSAGGNRILLRDIAGRSGPLDYTLRILTDGDDAVPENNSSRLMVGVDRPRGLLLVSDRPHSALASLLKSGGLDVEVAGPQEVDWSLERLSKYAAVIIENIPARQIGGAGLETLAAWVTHAGGGLMMTGGRQSYGTGGYFKSPLDRVLPVTMELRQEHRKYSLAMVVVLDRSGSMTAPVRGNKTKMDLANLATAEVIRLLSPMDQFACLAVDTEPHTIVGMTPVTDPEAMAGRVLKIQSTGGGIFVYEGLSAAAGMVTATTAGARHIVLFADAADSEEPGDYKKLIGNLQKAGVTLSVIALGSESDLDANLLKDIAQRGRGQCIFTDNAEELPQLFVQDTLLVARSAFVDEPTAVRQTAAMNTITPERLGPMPDVGGYNLCYIRPEAQPAVLTQDDNLAPLVAAWQVGSGRVLCYTGEADGEYSGKLARWGEVDRFYGSLARWSAGGDNDLKGDVAVTQNVDRGLYRVRLHLSPSREGDPFAALPQLVTLHARPGHSPTPQSTPMRWISADMLEAEVPLGSDETVLGRLDAHNVGETTLPPVCLPHSPEFAADNRRDGSRTLQRLSRSTGGTERVDLAGIWQGLPETATEVRISHWLATAVLLLLLADVAERRMGLLSRAGGGIRSGWQAGRRSVARIRPKLSGRRKRVRAPQASQKSPAAAGANLNKGGNDMGNSSGGAPPPLPPSSAAGAAAEGAKKDKSPVMQDALSQARMRAKSRMRR